MSSVSRGAPRLAVWCLAVGVPPLAADTTPPTIGGNVSLYAETPGERGDWVIAASEPLDRGSIPATDAFEFTICGVVRELSGVGIGYAGLGDSALVLTLRPPLPSRSEVRQVWRLVYAPPSENPLKDRAGNLAEAFDVSYGYPGGEDACDGPSGRDGEPEPDPDPAPETTPPVPPKAAFTVDVPCADGLCRARAGEDVTFTDTSSGTVARRSWDFDVAGGRAPSVATPRHAWFSPGFYEVSLTVSGAGEESTASRVFLVEAANPAGTCEPDAETICLQDSRYQVRATWRSPEGELLQARAARAGTNDSGLLWFHDEENWEVLVKVLEGCAITGADWVFVASATDLGLDIEITDTVTGEVRRYTKSPGVPGLATTDTAAFPESCQPQVRSEEEFGRYE